jgi:hypothetical protein
LTKEEAWRAFINMDEIDGKYIVGIEENTLHIERTRLHFTETASKSSAPLEPQPKE